MNYEIETGYIKVFHEQDFSQLYPLKNYMLNCSLKENLIHIKNEIDKYKNEWDIYKKYIYHYDFVHSDYDKETTCVCNYKPLSRSFFKLTEILSLHYFNLDTTIESLHIAEGPGGFIEAFKLFRNNDNDTYYGITLLNEDKLVPCWNKLETKYKNCSNIILEKGADNTGDLYCHETLLLFNEKYKNKFQFMTADGGFDFSEDFNKQEINSLPLLFCEITFALCCQKEKGIFIIKVFDTFSDVMIELIYLLYLVYNKIEFYKPTLSRTANSEKYIICKGYNYNETIVKKIITIHKNIKETNLKHFSFFYNHVNHSFIKNINEMNYIYGQIQIKNILQTILFIQNKHKKELIEKNKKNSLQKCIKWCKHMKLPIKEIYMKSILFKDTGS